ncbi:MAG TPA: adenosylcobinamide-GDP ribazoletransferase [Egibacteraceae bacterium]|nr:adenosylcobinamide-GDP ribazoletransferase [Egibacteraceae bacterium]
MAAALRYLTVLPVGGAGAVPGRRALAAFPVVGLLLGLAWAVPAAVLGRMALPLAVAAGIVLAVDAVLTRLVHLDAAARLADEVAGAPADRLRGGDEASHPLPPPPTGPGAPVGAAGTTALVVALLVRFGLLTFVAGFPGLLVAVPAAGRTAMVVAWWRARGGSATFEAPETGVALAATVLGAAVVFLTAHVPGLVGLGVALLVALAAAAWGRRSYGGLSDRHACACAIVAETAALMALAMAVIL